MEQLETDYLDLKQKYDNLNNRVIRNFLAMSLLINIFPKNISKLKDKEEQDTFLRGVVLIIKAYIFSLRGSNQAKYDLNEMNKIASDFYEELFAEEDREGGFITKFIKKTTKKNHD